MKHCTNCGNPIDDNAKFCEFCGKAVETEPVNDFTAANDEPQQTYAAYEEPVGNTYAGDQNGTYNAYQNQPNTDFNNNNQQGYSAFTPPVIIRPKAKVSFGEAIKMFFTRYVDFSGRSVKSEYWYWILFDVIVGIVLGILTKQSSIFSAITSLFTLATFIPSIAITFRRLHDVGKSGIYILIDLIPLVGWIIMIYYLAQDSVGDNEYGPAPEYPMPDNNTYYQQ